MFYGFAILTVIENGLYTGETCAYRCAFRVDKIVRFFNGCIVLGNDGEYDGDHIRVKETFDEIKDAIQNAFLVPQVQIPPYPVFT